MLRYKPGPALSAYVECFWYSTGDQHVSYARERAIPDGAISAVVSLSDDPLRIFRDETDTTGQSFPVSVVWGTQSTYSCRDTTRRGPAVGIQFRPGMAGPILGVPARELADRHIPLESIWNPASVSRFRQILLAGASPHQIFRLLETELKARIAARGPLLIHPAVAHALSSIDVRPSVHSIQGLQREAGYSPKVFIELFSAAVGLTPKFYSRVRRLNSALRELAGARKVNWAGLAGDSGYYDQSHMIRDFRLLTGLSPGQYEPASGDRPLHVPVR